MFQFFFRTFVHYMYIHEKLERIHSNIIADNLWFNHHGVSLCAVL